MLNIMNPPADWSTLKKLIWLRGTPITGGEELTVSGTPPLSLPNSLGKPLKAWEVDVLSKQDLHGYDAPWPAGGGKNKLNTNTVTSTGITFTPDADGYVSANPANSDPRSWGYNSAQYKLTLSAGTYTLVYDLKTSTTNPNRGLQIWSSEGTQIYSLAPVQMDTSNTGNFTLSETTDIGLMVKLYDSKARFAIVVSTDAHVWSPYSNICPISGTDKVTVYTDSKYGGLVEWNQICDNELAPTSRDGLTITRNIDGTFTVNGTATSATVTASGWFGLDKDTAEYLAMSNHKVLVSYKLLSGTLTGSSKIQLTGNNYATTLGEEKIHSIGTLSPSSNTSRCAWSASAEDGYPTFSNAKLVIQVHDLTAMFGAGNEPSTAEEFRALFPNDYYAYNAGQQMTVDQVNGAQYSPAVLTLPQTVYTGTVGSEGGENGSAIVDLGTLAWMNNGADNVYGFVTDKKIGSQYGRCTALKQVASGTSGADMPNGSYRCNSSNNSIAIKLSGITADNASTMLSGMMLEYELATSVQFPLTTPDIPTPKGNAYTWATAEDGTVESMGVTYVGKA